MRHVSWMAGLLLAVLTSASALASTTINYVYDDHNRLQTVTRSDGPTYSFTYDEAGNITQQDTNNPDTDGDGLKNIDEIHAYNTDPTKVDTDGDTLSDSVEVNTYGTDPNKFDTDGDGYNDDVEIANGSNPLDMLSIPAALATGDINGDGVVNAGDVVLAQRIAMGLATATSDQLTRGDVAPANAPDGVINAADLVVIQRTALGLTTY